MRAARGKAAAKDRRGQVEDIGSPRPRQAAKCRTDRRDILFGYSHRDKRWLTDFQTMLKPLVRIRTIRAWDDTLIKPGSRWRAQIARALKSAAVAVLLVSSDFLASDFIAREELPPLLRAARKDGLTIIWVLVSSCMFEVTALSEFQAANDTSRPLDTMTKPIRQAAVADICRQIETLSRNS